MYRINIYKQSLLVIVYLVVVLGRIDSAYADNVNGEWSSVGDWPFVAIHAALTPDGRIVTYGADGAGGKGRTGAFRYDVWDPVLGLAANSHLTLPNTTGTDLFCSAQILLPDNGDLLIAGGDTFTDGNPIDGIDDDDNMEINDTTLFSASSNSLTSSVKMNRARWYATTTMLPSGDVYIQSGKGGADFPELRTRNGLYRLQTGADTNAYHYWYPRNFVTPSGHIYGFDINAKTYFVSPYDNGLLESTGTLNGGSGAYSSQAMYQPGKILHTSVVGGQVKIIDLNRFTPVITDTSSLSTLRAWLNLTVLPDGKVLATGGSAIDNQLGPNGSAVNNAAEIWDPTTGQWVIGAEGSEPRLYHSVGILLPDASVLVAGGGLDGPVLNRNAEIYYPPYLYDSSGDFAIRPVILSGPDTLDYGASFSLQVGQSNSISRVTFLKLGSVTHSFNVEQRFLELNFTQSGQALTIRAPSDHNYATPGYYMIFVIDGQGVPCEAKIVLLDGDANFGTVSNAGIPGYNQEILFNTRRDQCLSACVQRGWCKSLDYSLVEQACYLQPVAEEDVGPLKRDYVGNPYDHYYYKPRLQKGGDFATVLNAGIPDHNQEILQNQSLSQCKTSCAERNWCKSVDFDRASLICYLQPVSEEDVGPLKRDYVGDPYDHYFYKPRLTNGGFVSVPNAGIPGYNQEILSNVSLEQCKSDCVSRDWCRSADYDRAGNICYLQPVAEQHVGALKYDYPGNPYDHYYYIPRLD